MNEIVDIKSKAIIVQYIFSVQEVQNGEQKLLPRITLFIIITN